MRGWERWLRSSAAKAAWRTRWSCMCMGWSGDGDDVSCDGCMASDVRDDEGLDEMEMEHRPPAAASSRDLYVLETASLRKDERVTSLSERDHLVRPMLWALWKVAVASLIGQIDPRDNTADRPSVRIYAVHSSAIS